MGAENATRPDDNAINIGEPVVFAGQPPNQRENFGAAELSDKGDKNSSGLLQMVSKFLFSILN